MRGCLSRLAWCVQLADFGLSRVLDTDRTHVSTQTYGTLAYQPAELLQDGRLTKAADVHSFSMIMYEMYTKQRLFDGCNTGQVTLRGLLAPLLPSDRANPLTPAHWKVTLVRCRLLSRNPRIGQRCSCCTTTLLYGGLKLWHHGCAGVLQDPDGLPTEPASGDACGLQECHDILLEHRPTGPPRL